jgi:hypothetical protein
MWIDRLIAQVQGRGLWEVRQTINRAVRCASLQSSFWENQARITLSLSTRISQRRVRDLLSFKNSERFRANASQPLMSY